MVLQLCEAGFAWRYGSGANIEIAWEDSNQGWLLRTSAVKSHGGRLGLG